MLEEKGREGGSWEVEEGGGEGSREAEGGKGEAPWEIPKKLIFKNAWAVFLGLRTGQDARPFGTEGKRKRERKSDKDKSEIK